MKWSILSKFVVKSIPHIISFVEQRSNDNPHKSNGQEKLEEFTELITKEVVILESETSKKVMSHPKVKEALENAASALVNVQNVITVIEKNNSLE